ncbi:MAG: hypothetical protein ACRDY1_12460, partial [Acidimicrobiales bacterium]
MGVRRLGAVVGAAVVSAVVFAGVGTPAALATPIWSPSEAPLPGGGGTTTPANAWTPFSAVACPASGSCVAVGYDVDPQGDVLPLVETWSGGVWNSAAVALPADAVTTGQDSTLTALSCPAPGSCVAVGSYVNGTGVQGLIETSSDGTWTATTAPAPDNSVFPQEPDATLTEVVCPSVGSCVVVGDYEDTIGNSVGLVETLSAGTWTPMEAPLPGNADQGVNLNSKLLGLACPAPGSCVAVGDDNINVSSADGLIETLSGGMWTPLEASVPSGGLGGSLT